MKTVIKKDFFEMYKSIGIYLVIMILVNILSKFINLLNDSFFVSGMTVGMSMATLNMIFAIDVYKSFDILLYPIDRKELVKAKFIEFLTIALMFLPIVLISFIQIDSGIDFKIIFVSFLFICSITSYLYPLNLKFDGLLKGMGIFLLLIMEVLIGILMFKYNAFVMNLVMNYKIITGVMLILLLYCSYLLSIKIITKKEF